jgi:hypothetical protein
MLLMDKMMMLVEHVKVVVEVMNDYNNVDIDPMMMVMLKKQQQLQQLHKDLMLNMDVE